VKTGLPKDGPVENAPKRLMRDSAGFLVGEFVEASKPEPAYLKWSMSSKSWQAFKPGVCDGGWLVGNTENDHMYLKQNSTATSTADICAFKAQ
jgi:hypothetical protein